MVKPCAENPDVLINGHIDDVDLIKHLAESLSKENLKVWFPTAEEGEANVNVDRLITETMVYIPVLSTSCLQDHVIKDRISLAYISSRAIYPVAKQNYPTLASKIDGGMRLILSRIQWTFFLKDKHYEDNTPGLVKNIMDEVAAVSGEPRQEEDTLGEDPYDLLRGRNHLASLYQDGSNPGALANQSSASLNDLDFWQRNFGTATEIAVTSFRKKFIEEYGKRIVEDFGASQSSLFENLLIKDVFELKHVVSKKMYSDFIGKPSKNNRDFFFDRISSYVAAHTAMKEVFDMNSTVRLTAIRQLAEFKTPPVIKHLKQLTEDKDPNIQAVAALALAKTGVKSDAHEDILIKMMTNKDRLVRESACLSLAHMKSKKAIKHILHLWRNDPIKHVREAAELALSRAGQEDAQEAMRITQVLTKEVAALKDLKSTVQKT